MLVITDVVVKHINRAFAEGCLFGFRDEQLEEMFIVVNECLQQCFVQVVSLQATNEITFYNSGPKTGPFFKVCNLCVR